MIAVPLRTVVIRLELPGTGTVIFSRTMRTDPVLPRASHASRGYTVPVPICLILAVCVISTPINLFSTARDLFSLCARLITWTWCRNATNCFFFYFASRKRSILDRCVIQYFSVLSDTHAMAVTTRIFSRIAGKSLYFELYGQSSSTLIDVGDSWNFTTALNIASTSWFVLLNPVGRVRSSGHYNRSVRIITHSLACRVLYVWMLRA